MARVLSHLVITCQGKKATTTLRYNSADPFAVELEFPGKNTWTFDRDLLVCGQTFDVGFGDVLIRPTDAGIEITLRTPYGQAAITFDRDAIADAIRKTLDLVPFGTERIDIDKEIAKSGLTGYSKGGTR